MAKEIKKLTFCKVLADEFENASMTNIPKISDLYKQSLRSREGMRKVLQRAFDAALENLMSWERFAVANGFEVNVISDVTSGSPQPNFTDDGKVFFTQRYGVVVTESEVK